MTDESKMEVEPTTTTTAEEPKKDENVNPSAGSEAAAEYPDMELAQSIHRAILIQNPKSKFTAEDAASLGMTSGIEGVLEKVKKMENPSLYRHLAPILGWTDVSEEALAEMEKKNTEAMAELEKKVEDAKENAGDMEVLDARFEVAKFAAKSLSKDEALAAYQKVLDLPKLSRGKQMDALMESSRIVSFYGDTKSNAEFVKKVSSCLQCTSSYKCAVIFLVEFAFAII
jgi:hypothetical protein